jgi:hypothetical protein
LGERFASGAAVLAIKGINVKSIVMALQVIARWSFLFFWLAYAGKAMNTLFGPTFAPLARGREFGLAYASAMLSHVGLLVSLYEITSRVPLAGSGLVFFGIGIVFTYVLAVLSFGRLAEALGATGWRALRFVGMNYILYAFASDFVPAATHPGTAHHGILRSLAYVPFAAMSIAAPLLVLAAAAYRRLGMRHSREVLRAAVN